MGILVMGRGLKHQWLTLTGDLAFMATGDDPFIITINYLHEVYFTLCCYSALVAFKTFCSAHKA